jgi:hypothetical protein
VFAGECGLIFIFHISLGMLGPVTSGSALKNLRARKVGKKLTAENEKLKWRERKTEVPPSLRAMA